MKKSWCISFLIFVFLLLPLFISNVNHQNFVENNPTTPLESSPLYLTQYSTITSPLNVTEYANRIDANQEVLLRYNVTSGTTINGSAAAVLPPNWQGNSIDVNLYNLYENRCWNLNPEMDGYFTGTDSFARVFEYGNGYLAGMRSDNGLDKMLYLPFSFGSITNATNDYNATEVQDLILSRTLTWMGVGSADDILIIDDDDGYETQANYSESLARLGYTQVTIDPAPNNYPNDIQNRRLIIWCCGENWDIDTYTTWLTDFLAETGAQGLIVSGQDVGYDLEYQAQDITFYHDVLRSKYYEDVSGSSVVEGLNGDVISDQLTFFINGTGTNFWPDAIMSVFPNSGTALNNWTGYESGNDYAEDWYYRYEPQAREMNDSAAVLMLQDAGDNGYDVGDKVWIEQVVYLNRSEIIWSGINMDYWALNAFGEYSGSFKLFVSINDTEVFAKAMSTVVPLTSWHNLGINPISTSAFTVPGPISIKIGLEVTAAVNYDPDIVPIFVIDNFKLFVKSKVSPDQINLEMDSVAVDGGAGYGNCTITPPNPWLSTPVRVNFTWVPTESEFFNHDVIVSFTCDTNLFASKNGQTLYTADPSKTGVLLDADHGVNNSWSFQYYVNIPTGYWNHSISLDIPPDWTLTFVSEPQLPLINKLNECRYGSFIVPSTNITNSPDGYWRFEAYSPNYIYEIQPQIYNGTHWINTTQFQVTNITRIMSYISNGTGPPPNLAESSINLTIIDPDSQLWWSNTNPSYQNGWAIFPNLTIFGLNTSGGNYQIQISWDNEIEAGYIESSFTIIHNTELVLAQPSDAIVDQTTEVNFGELLLVRVGLNDTDRNELKKGVEVSLNWSQGGSPVQKSLTDLETGQYEVVLDTSDLPSIDNYTIIVNSSSPYYSSSLYTLKLIVTTETLLSSPQYPKVISEWGPNVTIHVDYLRALDEVGINDSNVMVNWTLGPHSVTEISSGRYDIEINLSFAELREYTLEINATKANCAFKILRMKLEVQAIGTDLSSDSYPRTSTEWNNNVTIQIDYQTLGLQGIESAQISINWTQNYYSIVPLGNGVYELELNISWCDLRNYKLQINASKMYHQNKTLYITIEVKSVEALLTSPQFPKIITTWGGNITIQIDYLRAGDSQGILNATISANWTVGPYSINEAVNGRYNIELDLSYADILEYTLQINASKAKHSFETLLIKIEVKAIETDLVSPDYPRVIEEWGNKITLSVNFRTALGLTGINDSIVEANWTGAHTITPLGNGIYQIELNTSWCNLQEYLLQINCSKAYHLNKSIYLTIEIDPIATELVSDEYPRVTTEWNTNVTITIDYHTINPHGINNSLITINWSASCYAITPLGNGLYEIELNTSCYPLGNQLLEINASKVYHENQTLRITIEIDPIETELTSPDFPRVIGEWNINHTIQIDYHTVSSSQGIPDAIVFVNWTTPYYSIGALGGGIYEIEINTSCFDVGIIILEINTAQTYHENKTLRIIVEIDATETELTSIQYPRVIDEWGSNVTIELDYRTVSGSQGISGATVSANWTVPYFHIIALGAGSYEIEINTSCCDLDDYIIEINVSRQYYEQKTLRITVQVDPIATELTSIHYPRVIGEWGSNVTIELDYRTVSESQGISGATVSVNWTVPYFHIIALGAGNYEIEVNTSCYDLNDYIIEINVSRQYYEQKTLRITVQVDPIATELTSIHYPRIIGEWGENLTVQISYQGVVSSTGISDAVITANWTIPYYTIRAIGSGIYEIELNTSWCDLQDYVLEINAAQTYHENKTIKIIVDVNAVETELLSINYPRVIAEWNIDTVITIDFHKVIGPVGIPNATIAVNWTATYYTISPLGGGIYEIELNSSWCSIAEYVLEITASKPFHQNKTLRITIEIKAAETDLISVNYPRVVSEWGYNTTIELNYRLATTLEGINGSTITCNWTSPYYTIYEIGNGIYHIELNTSWTIPQEYILSINASKAYHYTKSLNIIIELTAIETELISNEYPRVVGEWGRNVTVEVNFRAKLDLAGVTNATIMANWTASYYSISEVAAGIYSVELNTSWCDIQEYFLTINASKQYHTDKTIRITVQINLVETKLVYGAISTVPYGQNATIHFKYTDFAGTPILSETDGSDVLSVNATHWLSYNPLDAYPYTLIIETSGLELTDLLNITATKLNHKTQTVFIILNYRPIFTSFTNLNASLVILPLQESTSIQVVFNDTENNVGIENASFTFYGYSDLSAEGIGNGNYKITINAGNTSDSFTILVTINRTGYLDKSLQFILQIKQWTEFTSVTFSSDVVTEPIGTDAHFSLLLEDEFTGTYFNDSDIVVEYSWTYGTGLLTYNGNGNYSLTLNTAGRPAGTYHIMINATTKSGHLLSSRTVTLVITGEAIAWYVRYSWIFGIVGAALAIFAGYTFQKRWKQRNWERRVKHLYVLTKNGIPLYDKRLGGVSSAEPSLVTSALIGISSIVQEIVDSERALKTIDHMDNKILFAHGHHVIVAVLSEVDFPIIRKRISQFTNRFEFYFRQQLEEWKGDVDSFFGASKLINEFFPIEEYLEDKEISAEWLLERLFNLTGLSGIVVLLMVELGMTEPTKIIAGTGLKEKQVTVTLRTLRDLVLIDDDNKLTNIGTKALEIYKGRKEKYMSILKLMKD